jgi:pimeloyl-ACP methyl ester carboxylesterase
MAQTDTLPRIGLYTAGTTGPRVLFIMGFGMTGAVWTPQLEAFGPGHQAAAYDHLGVRTSEPPTGPVSMASMASDALRVMDHLKWDKAHVVSVSMGGMIAQHLALAAPERVQTLALIATHPGGVLAVVPPTQGIGPFLRAQTGAPAGRVQALKELLYTPEFLATVDEARLSARMEEMVGRRAPREIILGHLKAVLGHQTADRLHTLKMPVLIVRPGRDLLVNARGSDRLAKLLPHARVVRFDDAGHGLTFQAADALNRELMAHIAAHPETP